MPGQLDLDGVLCIKTSRRLNADSTVVHQGKVYLVEERVQTQSITVEDRLDGSVDLVIRDAGFAIERWLIGLGKLPFQCLVTVPRRDTIARRRITPGEAPYSRMVPRARSILPYLTASPGVIRRHHCEFFFFFFYI